jgi:hypothetical protein
MNSTSLVKDGEEGRIYLGVETACSCVPRGVVVYHCISPLWLGELEVGPLVWKRVNICKVNCRRLQMSFHSRLKER